MKTLTPAEAYEEGKRDYARGKQLKDNPFYDHERAHHTQWIMGWGDAAEELK